MSSKMNILLLLLTLTAVLHTPVLSQSTSMNSPEATTGETAPTTVPTTAPTTVPTTAPTTIPTTAPTTVPTTAPTTVPTTASTTAPTVPTTAPTTVPTVPTTEPTVPTTAPTTAPTEAPHTTVSPDQKCFWNVTCIKVELKAKFIIPIEEGKNTSEIDLGCHARLLETDCSSNETQSFVLVDEPNRYNFTMIFEKNDGKVFVRNITLDYILPDGERGSVANNSELFSVKAGKSYLCSSESTIKLENVTMEVSEIHIQAFAEKDDVNFGDPEECPKVPQVSDVVPIAVGVALLALIIVVLIAYLVGRRRSQQKGYQPFQS